MANFGEEKSVFITIQNWMVKKLHLKSNELIIYALIHGFCQDGKSYFYGSIKYIMENTNLSKETVLTVLQSLVKKCLIVKKDVRNYQIFDSLKSAQGSQHFCLYYTAASRNGNFTGQETRPASSGRSKNLTGASQESVPVAGQEFRPNNLLDNKADTAAPESQNSGQQRKNGILKKTAEAEPLITQELKKLFGGHLVFDSEFVPEIARLLERFGIEKRDIPAYLKFALERTEEKKPKSLTNLFHALAKSSAVMQDFALSLKKAADSQNLTYATCPVCAHEKVNRYSICPECGFDLADLCDQKKVGIAQKVWSFPPEQRSRFRADKEAFIKRQMSIGFAQFADKNTREQLNSEMNEIYRKYGIEV